MVMRIADRQLRLEGRFGRLRKPVAVLRWYGHGAFSCQSSVPVGSVRERIGAQLEMHDERARQRLAWRARTGRVDAFDVHRRSIAGRHPQPTPLPPRLRVVDATVDTLGEEAHRIGDAEL